jgi:hypothetical protein
LIDFEYSCNPQNSAHSLAFINSPMRDYNFENNAVLKKTEEEDKFKNQF